MASAKLVSPLLLCLALSACGGGTKETQIKPITKKSYTLNGMAIKGPIANIQVAVYKVDSTKPDLKGSLVIKGNSNNSAEFHNITISEPMDDFYLIEATSTSESIDLLTSQPPILNTMISLVSSVQLKNNTSINTTPLTTLIVTLLTKIKKDDTSVNESLKKATVLTQQLFNFGGSQDFNPFTFPALLVEDTSKTQKILEHRTQLEAIAVLIESLSTGLKIDSNATFELLARDIKDGVINASEDSNENILDITDINNYFDLLLGAPIAHMTLKNTGAGTPFNLAQIAQLLVEEQSILKTGINSDALASGEVNFLPVTLSSDTDKDGYPDLTDIDDDNDGVLDDIDSFPLDPTESSDNDLDGLGNNSDPDDDNDGVLDIDDAFPFDATESLDTDKDGLGNNKDLDDDNDGVPDSSDAFPLDATESVDTDLDGIGNNADTDDDNDGFPDENDAFPLDTAEWLDTDKDGIGNNQDKDDDNDGVPDSSDAFPLDPTEYLDNDRDGLGNNSDPDDDNDGVLDLHDAFPFDASEWLDTDNDGIGNNKDKDDDNDGVPDLEDAFPLNPAEQFDYDKDGIGNNEDLDDDNDGYLDTEDQFPFNKDEWIDTDLDGLGNNQDSDDDGDGEPDTTDSFPLDPSEQFDNDDDGQGDNRDLDDDNDGFLDTEDKFPFDKTEWLDSDNDGLGNNADADDDDDGVLDSDDLFPLDPNEQYDLDLDGVGDNSDPDIDGDGIKNDSDAFPKDKNEWIDSDADSIGNNSDQDDDNDGTLDENDAFPLDPSEQTDFDNDGLGDNKDPDDDNDGVFDSNDNITLGGIKNSYFTGEKVNVKVRGMHNNTTLEGHNGWHVQYYSYNLTNPGKSIQKYIQDGYYNAIYEQNSKEWLISFPLVNYSGSFKTIATLYCSRADKMCGEKEQFNQWEQTFSYQIKCGDNSNCEYIPDEEPGINVTADIEGFSYVTSIIKRNNGDIYTALQHFGSQSSFSIRSSSNFGQTWQHSSTLEPSFFSGEPLLFESIDDSLYLVNQCSNSLCFLKYNESDTWTNISSLNIENSCSSPDCSIRSIDVNSLIQTHSGKFILSYHAFYSNYTKSDIYVTESTDLLSWSEPIRLSDGISHNLSSKLIELDNGSILAAYYSNDSNSIITAISENGVNWTESQRVGTYFARNLSLLKVDGQIRLFYSSFDNFYSQILNTDLKFENKTLIQETKSFGPLIINLKPKSYGIIYTQDLNETRDVFFEEITINY